MNDNHDYDAELRDWTLANYYGGKIGFGRVYNDRKERFQDGETIRTSKVLRIEGGRILQTRNTRYLLVGGGPEFAA